MALSEDALKFACDDARRRHDAVVQLIAAIDRQALGVFQLYVTLSAATLSGGVAIVFGSNQSALPHELGYGLVGFACLTVLGATHALFAMWPSRINLPGRAANFWQWADDHATDASEAYRCYLTGLIDAASRNAVLNQRMADQLQKSKVLALFAPLAFLAFALVAHFARL